LRLLEAGVSELNLLIIGRVGYDGPSKVCMVASLLDEVVD